MFSVVPRMCNQELVPWTEPVWTEELSRLPALFNRFMAEPLCHFGESEVHNTDKEFRVRMDLQNFKPEEVKITSDNSRITVHAKHEEKQDSHDRHSFISREVTRSYTLPENADPRSVTSSMNNQGILNIKVDKRAIEAPKETPIPVQFK